MNVRRRSRTMTPFTDQNFDWDRIVQLRNMPKLDEVCPEPRKVFDDYYQIGPTEYVCAAFEWRDFDFLEQAVFVSAFIFAPTFASFRRITSRSVAFASADDGITLPLPSPFHCAPHCTTFAAIREFTTRQSGQRFLEDDLYADTSSVEETSHLRIGHYLAIPRFTFYFRSSSPVPPDEPAFAAEFDARDDRRLERYWTPC